MNATIEHVFFTTDQLRLQLSDGTAFAIALAHYPSLLNATISTRDAWELCAAGTGIHWPAIDEDLSLGGLLRNATKLSTVTATASLASHSPSL